MCDATGSAIEARDLCAVGESSERCASGDVERRDGDGFGRIDHDGDGVGCCHGLCRLVIMET